MNNKIETAGGIVLKNDKILFIFKRGIWDLPKGKVEEGNSSKKTAKIEISEETSAADIEGWDSLTHIILIVETEKKFNVKFNSKEISNWKNVGEMILSIESKI